MHLLRVTNKFSLYITLFVCTVVLLLARSAVAQSSGTSGHRDWQGWSFDYEVSGDYDGLSLSSVTYQGRTILSKASFPVMRVFYDNDVCGPYADRLGGTLTPEAGPTTPWWCSANSPKMVTTG